MLLETLSHDVGLQCQFSGRRNDNASDRSCLAANIRLHQDLEHGNQKGECLSRSRARACVDVLVGKEVGNDGRLNGRRRCEMHLLQRIQHFGE